MNERATRQRLLDATAACVRERGLVGTTSRAITATAEANLAAITYHFGSKDDLVTQALLGVIRAALGPALATLARTDLDPATRAVQAAAALRTAFAAAAADAPAYAEAVVQARHLPDLHRALLELAGELRTFLADQIAGLDLPGWVDPPAMATLLLAVLNGVVVQAALDPDGTDVDAVAGQFLSLLLAAGSRP